MTAEIAPLARLSWPSSRRGSRPGWGMTSPPGAHIAQREAEAEADAGPDGPSLRAHTDRLRADRQEITARVLGFNSAVVFVQAMFSGAARLGRCASRSASPRRSRCWRR